MSGQRETAILLTADHHYGKQTPSYDPDVYRKRMAKLGDTLTRIKELLGPAYDIEELVPVYLGDVGDGTDIYKTQPHHQAITNVERQANEWASFNAMWLHNQRENWPIKRIIVVPGNHGLGGRFAAEGANWDVVSYRYLADRLRGDSVEVVLNEKSDPFVQKVNIRGHNYVFYHGHDIRSYASIPWYGIMLRLVRWLSTSMAPFDVACMGHFHTFGLWKMNNLQVLMTGSMVTDDEWSLRTLGYEGSTQWWLIGCSNKYPITWSFGINLA